MTFHIKILIVPNPFRINVDKIDGFIRFYLALKNMMLLTTALDIL